MGFNELSLLVVAELENFHTTDNNDLLTTISNQRNVTARICDRWREILEVVAKQ